MKKTKNIPKKIIVTTKETGFFDKILTIILIFILSRFIKNLFNELNKNGTSKKK